MCFVQRWWPTCGGSTTTPRYGETQTNSGPNGIWTKTGVSWSPVTWSRSRWAHVGVWGSSLPATSVSCSGRSFCKSSLSRATRFRESPPWRKTPGRWWTVLSTSWSGSSHVTEATLDSCHLSIVNLQLHFIACFRLSNVTAYCCVTNITAYRCMTNVIAYRCVTNLVAYRCVTNVIAYRWGEVGDSSQSFSSDTLQGTSSEWSEVQPNWIINRKAGFSLVETVANKKGFRRSTLWISYFTPSLSSVPPNACSSCCLSLRVKRHCLSLRD